MEHRVASELSTTPLALMAEKEEEEGGGEDGEKGGGTGDSKREKTQKVKKNSKFFFRSSESNRMRNQTFFSSLQVLESTAHSGEERGTDVRHIYSNINLWKVCAKIKVLFCSFNYPTQGNSEITDAAGGSPERKRLKVDPEKDAPQKLENL